MLTVSSLLCCLSAVGIGRWLAEPVLFDTRNLRRQRVGYIAVALNVVSAAELSRFPGMRQMTPQALKPRRANNVRLGNMSALFRVAVGVPQRIFGVGSSYTLSPLADL